MQWRTLPEDLFAEERAAATRQAMIGRLVVIAVIAAWIVFSRTPPRMWYMLGGCAVFAGLTLLHLRMVRDYIRFPALPYAFYALDVVLILIGIAVARFTVFEALPASAIYLFNYFPFFFLVLISTGVSLSPKVVIWTGLWIAVGWMVLFQWLDTPPGLGWSDIPADAEGDAYLAYILSPNFTAMGSRLQEALIVLAVAGLLALIVKRARGLVARQIAVERNRRAVREAFGHYVPDAIAEATIAAGGELPPEERRATVLFCDLAGFTSLTHDLGPERIVGVLNAWFDRVAREVGAQGGVITQFQGDAALAVFNAPSDLADHAKAALTAARAIERAAATETFVDRRLATRIGIASGFLIAGTVGGEGRRGYTVHGDAVNLAARLEALNKVLGTTVLMDAEAAAALRTSVALREFESVAVAGLAEPISVFTPEE